MQAYPGPNPFAPGPVVVHAVQDLHVAGAEVQAVRARLAGAFPG